MSMTLETVSDEMILDNIGLVLSIANKFYLRDGIIDRDDLIGVGMTAFAMACVRFKLEYGCELSTFAVPYIRGAIANYLRDYGPAIRVPRWRTDPDNWPSIYKSLDDVDSDTGGLLADMIVDPHDPFADVDTRLDAEMAFRRLTPRQHEAFDLRSLGFEHGEIGERMGVTSQRAAQLVKRAKERLAEAYGAGEI